METSQELQQLAEALAKAQAELSPVPFDSNNPFYKSRYASLSAVIAEVRKVLPKHGLSIVQTPTSHMEFGVFYAGVETMLIHDSGEWIKSTVSVPVVATELIEVFTKRFNKDGDAYYASPNILQEAGKIITYLRRYGIVSILMLSAEEDIDGNEPVQQVQPVVRKVEAKKSVSEKKADEKVVDDKKQPSRPYSPEELKIALTRAAENPKLIPGTEKERSIVAAVLSQFAGDDDLRHAIQKFLFDSDSIKNVSSKMIAAAILWLDPQYDAENKEYIVPEVVIDEIESLINIL
jgi:hypothetical protein